ncbi:hypothetical protein [Botrimarina mediterranea]|uniref:Uncharacterized protein n=1 Tax=Botrimarina mediterranea TaxID=2528022 RepID=A0A518K5J1_9BACT|nr:hypothetical protein [Botrimarina mediterranea]QDV73062.1 hypothetical protein Spa11_12510 [Botrimarina mediterranea]
MDCEFEEKQYEQHLNNELLSRKHLLYVPGQVLEGKLGFDAALFCRDRRFWELFDDFRFFGHFRFIRRLWYASSRSGVQLSVDWWRELDQALPYFPRFRFNVFVQHKRPDYLVASSAGEWDQWNRPYYRYKIMSHQQKALEQLETLAGSKAIVVYASPAFAKLGELWSAVNNRQLIEKSNFCQPRKLSGHHAYSYVEPGRVGKAHSDAEDVESFDFYERFNVLSETAELSEDNRAFLTQLGRLVVEAIEDCGDLTDRFNAILATFDRREENDIIGSMSQISTFNFVVGTTWSVSVAPN